MTRPNINQIMRALTWGQFRKGTREDFFAFAGCTSDALFLDLDGWTIIWDRDDEGGNPECFLTAYSESEQLMWRPGIDKDWQRI